MMLFLTDYGLFLLKTITCVAAILLTLAGILAISSGRNKSKSQLSIKNLNQYYDEMKTVLQHAIFDKKTLKNNIKAEKKLAKEKEKEKEKLQKKGIAPYRRKIFVIQFEGDIKASSVKDLREEITAILTTATVKDEVLVKINSTGGMVHTYGLAAAQLQRLRTHSIQLTVAIDKAAASGGYMMACVANTVLAAPFAIIGSIGVVAQIPNFHRYLDKHAIDVELLTAGKFKRTLTLFGKNTDKGRSKAQEEIEEVHDLFKDFIKKNRPIVDIEAIATGEHWYAVTAIDKQLVDRLITSDDYLLTASHTADIYEVSQEAKKTWPERFSNVVQACIDKAITTCLQREADSPYW